MSSTHLRKWQRQRARQLFLYSTNMWSMMGPIIVSFLSNRRIVHGRPEHGCHVSAEMSQNVIMMNSSEHIICWRTATVKSGTRRCISYWDLRCWHRLRILGAWAHHNIDSQTLSGIERGWEQPQKLVSYRVAFWSSSLLWLPSFRHLLLLGECDDFGSFSFHFLVDIAAKEDPFLIIYGYQVLQNACSQNRTIFLVCIALLLLLQQLAVISRGFFHQV